MSSKYSRETGTDAIEPGTTSRLLAVLADGRRRRILSLLAARRDGVPEPELATEIASLEFGAPADAVTDDQFEAVHCSLSHHHLPKLEAIDLLERDDGVVSPSDSAVARSDLIAAALDADGSSADVDATLDLLASGKRRVVIDRLRSEGTATLGELVTALASEDERRRARISLLHQHLPKLAAAGVVEYERTGDPIEERRITYEGLPTESDLLDRLDADGPTNWAR